MLDYTVDFSKSLNTGEVPEDQKKTRSVNILKG